jgi:hypothetical protein
MCCVRSHLNFVFHGIFSPCDCGLLLFLPRVCTGGYYYETPTGFMNSLIRKCHPKVFPRGYLLCGKILLKLIYFTQNILMSKYSAWRCGQRLFHSPGVIVVTPLQDYFTRLFHFSNRTLVKFYLSPPPPVGHLPGLEDLLRLRFMRY